MSGNRLEMMSEGSIFKEMHGPERGGESKNDAVGGDMWGNVPRDRWREWVCEPIILCGM